MRTLAVLSLALLTVLAGCSVGYSAPGAPLGGVDSPTATAEPTATPGADPTPTSTATPAAVVSPPDPETDVLGWEDGYWANETLQLTRDDGLNESERRAVVARAMARVEVVRELEFEERVPVEIISRAEYRNSSFSQSGATSTAFSQFDNAKFEAMFLIGEDTDSLDVQNTNRGSSVLGFYSPRNDTIVIITEGDTPDLPGERTLGHELVHALQDQYYNLSSYRAETRMQYNAQNGLIEGDANLVQYRYEQRCGAEWECLPAPSGGGGGGGEFHLGVYILNYFPYSDGPGFVDYYRKQGGWERVNELYAAVPTSDAHVVFPEQYGSGPPMDVTFEDRTSNGWERVRPGTRPDGSSRPDYASLGQSGLTAMFAYTLYDDQNSSRVVQPQEFLNLEDGQVNRTDPFNYGFAYVSGYENDRMHVYANGEETGYVWKIAWNSSAEAQEFAEGYGRLLSHYGGTQVSTSGDTTVYRIADGPYADAFRVTVDGSTVTIVNAPSESALDDVYGGGA
ncbi:Hvo_1808 family surface protein [Halorarius litoreus]|uniref:Hvo_1808 family surface protein n=1 Tax=Halorarius litoreus TaxID=2962676 RepID=UPI0020CF892A|nr:Hvo_1808 family surface protein [Halorarius litoreus]